MTQENLNTEANFEIQAFKLHKLESSPDMACRLTREEALRYYRQMKTSRTMEAHIDELYKEKLARGFCHEYTGQEACAIGIVAAKDDEDSVITSYRCHPWTLLMGSTIKEVLCELTGNINGNVHGKGGSMHMYDPHFFGGNGIVGAQQSLGTGIAMAMKYKGLPNVCYTLFGDGAANQGQLYEVANMAELWKLPVIFICENNGYAMFTSVERGSACKEFYNRFNFLPGLWADGMDVLSVREAIRFAREYVVSGKGPIFVELATYRYMGHTANDSGLTYRRRSEIDEVRRSRDPIAHFREKIVESKLVSAQELEDINGQIAQEVEEAMAAARESKTLPKEALYSDLFTHTEPQLVRGVTVDESVIQPYLYTEDAVKAVGHIKADLV